MRTWIWIAIVLVIGVAAALMLGDVGHVLDKLDGFAWSGFAAAIGLALGNYAIRFVRWQFYLRLNDEKRGAIRVQATKRWRASSLQRA